jgi:serine/threonine-protein kinase ULK2
LKEKNIIHRDIKPENVFMHDGIAKLGDFGLCERGAIEIRNAMVGSLAFQAPETHSRHEYSHRADLYSLGMCFYEMLMGDIPFTVNDINNLLNCKLFLVSRVRNISNRHISEPTMNLLKRMLDADPNSRINSYQLRDEVQRIIANPAEFPTSSSLLVRQQRQNRNTSTA